MEDMGDKRKRYTKEFKLEAVRMLEAGRRTATRSRRTWGSAAAKCIGGARSWMPRANGPSRATEPRVTRSWSAFERRMPRSARIGRSCEK